MSNVVEFKPILFCFCGPTASGKSFLCRELASSDSTLQRSISTTTRSPRVGEKNGIDYYFVTAEEFQRRISAQAFLEHALFGSNNYGTELKNIGYAESAKRHLLFDIDVQGVTQLKALYPAQVVTIFVFPVSFAVLTKRLRDRGSENDEQINERLAIAMKEVALLKQPSFSDYLLINDERAESLVRARAIILAEKTRISRIAAADIDKLVS